MYILIEEDGNIVRSSSITDEMKLESDGGILTIIRIDNDIPMIYNSDCWEVVEKFEK